MVLMQRIHRGKTRMPPRVMLFGTEGIGKSTVASKMPFPIFVQVEDGLGEIDCHRFPLAKSYAEVEAALDELLREEHEYQSVVIDSLDWLERLIWAKVCEDTGATTIEKVDGGYGKGYIRALGYWQKIVEQLSALRDQRGMAVMLLAHAKVERFEDPEATAYDRYAPRLNKHAAALISEWCDAVLFATRKIITRTEDGGFSRSRTIASGLGKDGGDRILRCIGGPSCIAKNRYNLPAELPLDWSKLIAGIAASDDTPTDPQPKEN